MNKRLKSSALLITISLSSVFAGCGQTSEHLAKKQVDYKVIQKEEDNRLMSQIISSVHGNKNELIFKPIKSGSNGDIVKDVQNRLIAYGYNLTADGIYGQGCIDSIKDFQLRNFLDVDGTVGEITYKELMKEPTEDTKFIPVDYSKFNSDKLAFMNENSFTSKTSYFMLVDTSEKEVYILKGSNKNWTIYKQFSASVGKSDTPTIKGRFRLSGVKGYSFGEKDGFQCKYWTQISGNYLFHSVIYDVKGNYVTDGRLGYAISHGCIRLATENAKFIFENIPKDTPVIIRA